MLKQVSDSDFLNKRASFKKDGILFPCLDKQGSIRIDLQRLKTLFIRKGIEIEKKRIEAGDIRKNERNRSVEAIKKQQYMEMYCCFILFYLL